MKKPTLVLMMPSKIVTPNFMSSLGGSLSPKLLPLTEKLIKQDMTTFLDFIILGLVFVKINMLVMALQSWLLLHGMVVTEKLTSVSCIVTIRHRENGVIILATTNITLFANQQCKLALNLRHCFYDCIFKTMKYCMLILILFVIIMYIIILLNHIRKLYFVRIKPIDMFQKPTFSCCKNHYLEQEVQHIKNIKFVKYNYETNSYNIGHRYLPIWNVASKNWILMFPCFYHLCSKERKIFRNAKGQLNSEWLYDVIVSSKMISALKVY